MVRNALLIALGEVYETSNGRYEALNFPERNILHFGQILKGLGWNIELLINEFATSQNIIETIDSLSEKSQDGEVLLYLSGHTDKVRASSEADLEDEIFISFDNLLSGESSDFLSDDLLTSSINRSLDLYNCQSFTCFFETCFSEGLIDTTRLSQPDKVAVFASSAESIQTFFIRGTNGNSFYNRALRRALEIDPNQTYKELAGRLAGLVHAFGGGRRFLRPVISISNQLENHKLS